MHRAANETDAVAIAAIHVASWRDSGHPVLEPAFLAGPIEQDHLHLWSERLSDAPPNLSIEAACGPNGHLVGFIATYRDHDLHWGSMVDNLHVLRLMRGRRIGEGLLRSAARRLAAQGARNGLHLWVFEANGAGLRFYERLGGQVAGRDTSCIPAAGGKPVLRVHWPVLSTLF